ncbi:MAG: hypothetical protein WBL50_21120 [Candidatus Acidiferrum sp.]
MGPEHLQFGGGAEETALHPLVAVYLLIAIMLILFLPRRKAISVFLFAFFTIPIEQVVVLGGFHFTALRFLILAGLIRRVFSRKTSSDRFGSLDWAVLLWSISASIAFCLEYQEKQAIIKQMGELLDTLGGFLVVRFLIPDGETMRRTLKTLAVICVVLGICMVFEQVGHRNVFGYIGYPSVDVVVRNGHVRSGATLGCIHAGAFSGVLIPLFLWLWTDKKSRMIAYAGLVGALAMVFTSYSSTSFLALMGSIVGLACWPLRKQMRLVRWALACMLVGLHIVMKAPVWALIQRIDLTGSSSGTHRYMLVDMTFRHFSDWWLVGAKEYTTWGYDSWDLCNQFVAVALMGGLLTLIFYIVIFKLSFASIGTARKLANGDRDQEWLFWCFGASLFATVVAHFGINYMAQLIMAFFCLLVCIFVVTSEARQAATEKVAAPDREEFVFAPGAVGGYVPLRTAKQSRGSRFLSERDKAPSRG